MAGALRGIRSIEDFDLKDQRVFLRLDLNVPIKGGKIKDLTRIEASLPTIRYALEHGAKLVVASHLGRPEKDEDWVQFSLEPVAKKLQELLNTEVILVEDPDSEAPKALLRGLKPNQFLLLENLRFHADETENGDDLSEAIATYTDIYINDAFGASHRAHASIVGVPALIQKKGVGFLMKKELEMLDRLRQPEHPFVLLLGGAKVSDKIGVIENLVDKVDTVIVGGAMAYTFLTAMDVKVGSSRVEKEKLNYTRELVDRLKTRGKRLIVPVDHKVVPALDRVNDLQTTNGAAISDGLLGVDIGPKSVKEFSAAICAAKTVFWNGPMGIFETAEYSAGTFEVAAALSQVSGFTLVGGGDSAAAINASGFGDKVTHISTGGGASLEYLRGDKLPGVEALRGKGH